MIINALPVVWPKKNKKSLVSYVSTSTDKV